jgi:3'(2'), 5'-bisphosphate nucleotidase
MNNELEVARGAAQMAARLCIAVRQNMLGKPDSMEKAGREPVTIADYGAQVVILREIARHFPDDGVMAEERGADFAALATDVQRDHVVRHVAENIGMTVSASDIKAWLDFGRGQHAERLWAVDPIDGTQGFLRGDQFAIAIALLIKGEPVVAALACPLLAFDPTRPDRSPGVVALAVRGQGATLEALDDGSVRPLRVSAVQTAAEARTVESVESGHTDHGFSAGVLARVGVRGQPVRMDSQAKYAAVADGRAEIYIRHSQGEGYREKSWDHAAGALVVMEAGGRVTDLDGAALDFGAGDRLAYNRGILATNGPLHETILSAIRDAH